MSKIEQPNTELNIYSTEVLRECKFVVHIPKYLDRPDMHYVKEKLTMPDGTIVKNLRKIKEFKRPFYVLKEHFRNYKQKKESEHIDRLNRYTATESDLIEEAGKKLGPMYIGKNNLRYVKDSPYLYGCDITAATLIKKAYMDKFNLFTNYDVCVLDIEKEIDGDQRLTVMSISDAKRTFTAILKDWLPETKDNRDKLQNAYKRYIPNVEYMQDIEDVTEFYDTEVDMIVAIFKKLHEWQPDIVEVWNITYDIDNILKILDKAGINPADIFNDPSIPKRDRYFRFKKGKTSKVTEKGVHKGLAFQEQWHTVINIASFYFVDGASVYHYIRQGGKKVPGGYSLDNILKVHLGDSFKKLTIEDGIAEKLDKIAWHIYMSKNRKIEYVIYNKYDTRGPLLLDKEIKDICFTMPLLNVNSPFYMFDSNPVRIVENMYFFYLEKNEIMGTAPNTKDEDKKLGLGNWIIMLSSTKVKNNGMKFITELGDIQTMFRGNVYDNDQSAGYPSDGIVSNASKDTTMRELLKIGDIPKEDFKKQNINLFFGPSAHLEYAQTMFNFPSLFKVDTLIQKYLPKEKNSD